MKDTMTREEFYETLSGAPDAAVGFFETIDQHFARRNDCEVKFTGTDRGDMRLWGLWSRSEDKIRKNIFATLTWRPQKQEMFVRCKLTPDDLTALGLRGLAKHPTQATEPQNSDIYLDEDYWRLRVGPFVEILEAARIKLIALKDESA